MANDKEDDCQFVFKLLMLGDSGVGKSSILLRFTDDTFDEDVPCTIGVDFKSKKMEMNGVKVNVTIWDTAGQEKFRALTSSYYRGTHGLCLVYDVTRRDTFDSLDNWLKEIDMYTGRGKVVTKLLIGNKIDKDEDRQVTRAEGSEYARKLNMMFIETSAKTKEGVRQAFEELVQKILDCPEVCEIERRNVDILDQSSKREKDSSCGC